MTSESERSTPVHGPSDDQFGELSEILLGPERSQLAELKERLESPEARAKDVATVLPDAVRLGAARDARLRQALQRTIEEAIQVSVRSNPRMLAEALFPILGRAIRKAIAAEFDGMTESLNRILEQRLSFRSLRWRIEASRTHRSYAEIVVLRSLLYRVEQVYLIHRKTGLLLHHVSGGRDGQDAKDPEAISGMLTALQDFVRDTVTGAEDDNLETVRVGEFTVLLAYGPEAILAGFVRGVPPRKLDRLFQDELDSIHEEKAAALRAFDGETDDFDNMRIHLEKCLVGQAEPSAGPRRGSLAARRLLIGVPLLLIALPLGWWILSLRAERRWQDLVRQIRAQPGIVVTSSSEQSGAYSIFGLRDPLAADPAALVPASGIRASRIGFHWEPYYSMLPVFAEQRAYAEAKERLEKSKVEFTTGSALISNEQRVVINDVASRISALLNAAASTGHDALIEVTGATDAEGTKAANATLAHDRAANVQSALLELGVPAVRLAARESSVPCLTSKGGVEGASCRTATFHAVESGRK